MDKQTKKNLRMEIINLLDSKCDPCTIAACDTCAVKLQLNDLTLKLMPPKERAPAKGKEKELLGPKVMKTQVRHPHNEFVKLFKKDWTNAQIRKKLDVTDRTITSHRKRWLEANGLKRTYVHADYIPYFEQNMPILEIAKVLGVSRKTVWSHKNKWEYRNNV